MEKALNQMSDAERLKVISDHLSKINPDGALLVEVSAQDSIADICAREAGEWARDVIDETVGQMHPRVEADEDGDLAILVFGCEYLQEFLFKGKAKDLLHLEDYDIDSVKATRDSLERLLAHADEVLISRGAGDD